MHALHSHVKINYIGYLEDGTKFDDNEFGDPLDVIIGGGAVMRPIMSAVAEMEVGEERSVDIPCELAYGKYDPKACLIVPRSYIANGDALQEGERIIWHSAERPQPVAVKVVDANADTVRLDFNHPLAGKNLRYWIKVVDVVEAPVDCVA